MGNMRIAYTGGMNRKIAIGFIGVAMLLLVFGAIQPVSATFTKKAPIHINNTGGSALTDYQVMINITYDSDMNSNFSDIRVVNETSGETVPYWIENKSDGNWCKIWFNASYIPASSWCNDTYYLYYGNPSASSESDGDATFEFFDDFPTKEPDTISVTNDGIAYNHNVGIFRTPLWKFGENLYGTYLSGNGSLMVFKYSLTDSTVSIQDTGYDIADTEDPHCSPSIAVDEDGYIHVSLNNHVSGSPVFLRSTNPEDITSWETEDIPHTGTYVCYIRFIKDENGEIYAYYRDDSGSAPYPRKISKYNRTNQSWELVVSDLVNTSSNECYIDIVATPDGKFHLVGMWRTGAVGDSDFSHRNTFYAYSDDHGQTWKHVADGSTFTLPISEDQLTSSDIFETASQGTSIEIMNNQKCDANDSYIIVPYLKTDANDRLNYFVSVWNGSLWQVNQVSNYTDTPTKLYTNVERDIGRPSVFIASDGRAFLFTTKGSNGYIDVYYADSPYDSWSKVRFSPDAVGWAEYGAEYYYFKETKIMYWLWSPCQGSGAVPVKIYKWNFTDLPSLEINTEKWQNVLSGVSVGGSNLKLVHSDDNYGGDIFSKTTFTIPFILEYKWKAGMADVSEYVGMQSTIDPSNWIATSGVDWIIGFRFYRGSANGGSDAWKFNTVLDGSNSETESGTADNNWHRIKIVATSSSVKFYADDTLVTEHTTNIPDSPLYICADHGLYSGTDVESLVDNILVHKYADPEPTALLGAEQNVGGYEPYTITLQPGWNLIGWTDPTPKSAHSVGLEIGSNCTYIVERNRTTGLYVSHNMAGPEDENNFMLERGWGYYVRVSAETKWNRSA
ncbi:MAG: hypothetical protein DRP18_01215 [Candidatus Aenigmatarchaeota archaeon]|nr:MAG: hypothetical protein DRP18_01215 [Candidatus Aenigmarchaeota archaeon]